MDIFEDGAKIQAQHQQEHLGGLLQGSLGEYLSFLNFALGSCGEFLSCCQSCRQADQISEEDFEELDSLHYKLENGLLTLVRQLQKKLASGEQWDRTFHDPQESGG